MCPPLDDPIRPVRPVTSDVYVGRADFPGRVTRRTPRDPQDGEPGHAHHGHHEHHDAETGHTWTGPDEREPDAGTYDGHGRLGAHEDAHRSVQRHVDYSA
jgi:hypothetical protein